MKNDKQHKPMNHEELLKLLDEKSNGANTSWNDFDDFEKDALEGFTNNVDSNRVKDLLSELDAAISYKVAEQKTPSKKRGIVWFSAAASIILIIVISVFVLNKTKNVVNSNIALNEEQPTLPNKSLTEKNINENSITESLSGVKTQHDPVTIVNEMSRADENKTVLSDFKQKAKKKTTELTPEDEVADVLSVVNRSESKDFDNSLDDNKNVAAAEQTDEKPVSVTGSVITNDNLTSVVYSKETMAHDLALKSEDARTKYSDEVVVNTKKKSESDKSYVEKSEAKPDKVSVTTVMAPASSVSNNSMAISSLAYYNGGEKAIKEFVLLYLSEHKFTIQLKGKFNVVAYVTETGFLQVLKIDNPSNSCKECVKTLTDALNTMNNWSPSKQAGQAIKSKTEFSLEF